MDLEALERLARLRESGALTDEEYNLQKQRILANIDQEGWENQRSSVPIWIGGAALVVVVVFLAWGGFDADGDKPAIKEANPVAVQATQAVASDSPSASSMPSSPVSETLASPDPVKTPLSGNAIPNKVGDCSRTTIKSVGTRLRNEDGTFVPDSGSDMELQNGVYGVSYDTVPGLVRSKKGDGVLSCLVEIPENCPPGDDRGRTYTTTNLRTGDSWTLPDASHMCGGA